MGAGAGRRARGGALELNLGAPPLQMEEEERKQFCLERSRNRAGPGGLSSHPADVSIPALQAEPGGCTLFRVPTHLPLFSGRRSRAGGWRQVQRQTHRQTGWQKAGVPGGSEKERKPGIRRERSA